MRLFFVFLTLMVFSGCSREKPTGSWKISDSSITSEYPTRIDFTEDSISLRHPYFNFRKAYELKYKAEKYHFNHIKWGLKLFSDSLIINDNIKYYKLGVKDSFPELRLANISGNSLFQDRYVNETSILMAYIYDQRNSIPKLIVNDQLISLSDIHLIVMEFLTGSLHGPRLNIFLLIDERIKMRDVEKLFFTILKSNILKLQLVNSVDFSGLDKGLYEYNQVWKYQTLDCNLKPIEINEQYYQKINDGILPPPPPPVPEIIINSKDVENLYLTNNEIFYKDNKISKLELYALTESFVKDNKIIMALYDLESSYSHFLEFNSIIRNVYKSKREALSYQIFKKSFEDLVNEDKWIIRDKIPVLHFFQFSKDYYKEVITNPNVESTFKVVQ